MTLNALIAVLGLAGFLFLITAIRRFRLRHMSGGFFHGISALVLFLIAAIIFLISLNLRTYERLTAEAPAGEIQFAKVGVHQYNGVLTYPNGEVAYFPLSGDEPSSPRGTSRGRPPFCLHGNENSQNSWQAACIC